MSDHDICVDYHQAVSLKMAGFDWGCQDVWHFDREEFNFIPDYGATFVHPQDIPHWNSSDTWGKHIYSAPTLYTAAKWLREVHKLHITIIYDGECWIMNVVDMDVLSSGQGDTMQRMSSSIKSAHLMKTYEDALYVGITEALKLIV